MPGKPKPTHLKIFEGNPGKRHLPADEPEPPKADLENLQIPLFLDTQAKKTWEKLSGVLVNLTLLTQADLESFAVLCQLQSRLQAVQNDLKQLPGKLKKLKKQILAEKDETKRAMMLAEFEVLVGQEPKLMGFELKYATQLRAWAAEFGLTPRGRCGLKVGSGSKKQAKGADLLT